MKKNSMIDDAETEGEVYFALHFDEIKKMQKEALSKGFTSFKDVRKYISDKTMLLPSFLMMSCDTYEEYEKLRFGKEKRMKA